MYNRWSKKYYCSFAVISCFSPQTFFLWNVCLLMWEGENYWTHGISFLQAQSWYQVHCVHCVNMNKSSPSEICWISIVCYNKKCVNERLKKKKQPFQMHRETNWYILYVRYSKSTVLMLCFFPPAVCSTDKNDQKDRFKSVVKQGVQHAPVQESFQLFRPCAIGSWLSFQSHFLHFFGNIMAGSFCCPHMSTLMLTCDVSHTKLYAKILLAFW